MAHKRKDELESIIVLTKFHAPHVFGVINCNARECLIITTGFTVQLSVNKVAVVGIIGVCDAKIPRFSNSEGGFLSLSRRKSTVF